jgi:hypothetical protein
MGSTPILAGGNVFDPLGRSVYLVAAALFVPVGGGNKMKCKLCGQAVSPDLGSKPYCESCFSHIQTEMIDVAKQAAPVLLEKKSRVRRRGFWTFLVGLVLALLATLFVYLQRDNQTIAVPSAIVVGWIVVGFGFIEMIWLGKGGGWQKALRIIAGVCVGLAGAFLSFGFALPAPARPSNHDHHAPPTLDPKDLEFARSLASAIPVVATHELTVECRGAPAECPARIQKAMEGKVKLVSFRGAGPNRYLVTVSADEGLSASMFDTQDPSLKVLKLTAIQKQ